MLETINQIYIYVIEKIKVIQYYHLCHSILIRARLAQLVERETFNLKAKGSSPLSGDFFLHIYLHLVLKDTVIVLKEMLSGIKDSNGL